MRSAYHPSSIETRGAARRRSAAIVLTVIAHILIILLLLRLAPSPVAMPDVQRDPVTFQMMPDQPAPTPAPRTPSPTRVKRASGGSPPRAAPRAAASAQTPPAPPKSPPPLPIKLLGGMDMFEAADISKLPAHPEDQVAGGDGGSGAGSGKDSGSAYGPGEGPGGQRLYNAEWYREPSHAELNGYLPNGAPPGGWALIACKTIPNYQVENCRSLGESPVGSGLARAMRQAAYQFRVRPPRVGGKPMIGAWVKIRIDFTDAPPRN